MKARMTNPAVVIGEAWKPLAGLGKLWRKAGVPETTLQLVHLRVSQINGCGPCLHSAVNGAIKAGETHERLHLVSTWREYPEFTDAERAALALAESVTRLADREDPVPDPVWDAAAGHYTEEQLAALLLEIATTNLFNRLNVPTRQVVGVAW